MKEVNIVLVPTINVLTQLCRTYINFRQKTPTKDERKSPLLSDLQLVTEYQI